MSVEVEDFLAHYGVKGMKWGVRKKSGGKSKSRKERKPFITKNNARERALQLAATAYTAAYFYNLGKLTLPTMAAMHYNKRQAAAGAAFAANLFADTRGIPNYKTVVM